MSAEPGTPDPDPGLAHAVVVRTGARRVDVTGSDRLRYLEDVTTQAFTDVSAGDVCAGLYLDPHGAPLAMFDALLLSDRVALLAPDDEVAATLVDVLGQRTFLLDAAFALTDDEVVVLRGRGAADVAEAANLTTRPGTVRPAGGELFVVGRENGALDLVGPGDRVGEAVEMLASAGADVGTPADLDAWRVDAGVPAWGREVTRPHLPEESGVLPTHVHLAKGCYPGQEAVARMWVLGRPRRRLAVVAAVGGEVAEGWESGSGRRAVTVTTVAPGGRRALAFVPGDAEPGAVYGDDASVRVEVVRLVGDDEVPGHDPAMTRRRDRPRA